MSASARPRLVRRLRRLAERTRTSLWLVPGVAAGAGVLAAKLLARLDPAPDRPAWYRFDADTAGARELLSTIASSMLTLTAVVFSVTVLVLQIASSQFSPRVLGTFLEDRQTRFAMGAFVGTFVYALALLGEIQEAGPDRAASVPGLALSGAFALALLGVAVLVHYIHHMAHSVRAVHVIQRIGADTRRTIHSFHPDEGTDEPGHPRSLPDSSPSQVLENPQAGGVLAAVDLDELLALAVSSDVLLAVVPQLGDFVPRGAPLVRVWNGRIHEDARLCGCLQLEAERTAHQDPAFGFRQLVDIAVRALAPGINDPTTAVQALDELHDLLRLLAQRRFPPWELRDPAGMTRVVLPRPGWDDYVRLAIDEIRQYSDRSIQVARRLEAMIQDLLAVAPRQRRTILERERALLARATERSFRDGEDRRSAREPSAQGHGRA